jgi:hypothetical protein
VKISIIALNVNKAFLAHHLFNEDGEGLVENFQGEKLDKVMDKLQPLCFPTFETSLHPLSIILALGAPWITYFSSS